MALRINLEYPGWWDPDRCLGLGTIGITVTGIYTDISMESDSTRRMRLIAGFPGLLILLR